MRKIINHTLTILLILQLNDGITQTYSNHRAVEAYAQWNEEEPSVSIRWKFNENAQSYTIYKRRYSSTDWGNSIASLSGNDTIYVDNDVDTLIVYEYAIEKTTNIIDPFDRPNLLKGYSYITTAHKKPAVHSRGTMGLIVTENIETNLSAEVKVLIQDLHADGWKVFKEVLSSTASVSDVSLLIKARNKQFGCNAIYLLGHVPVPYSGLYCEDPDYPGPPDGHGKTDANSHCGAWPSDVYYGVIDGAWTDLDSTTLGKREENKNRIGDGKFDNIRIPGEVSIGVGRVDFSNLPALNKSEIELTRQYLNKIHLYKTGQVRLIQQGIIEDNFNSLAEGFGAGAVRDFYAICGKDGVIYDDVLNNTQNKNYALSYTCGAGWYYLCNGFGATINFNSRNAAAFNHLFGSFFGDFDSENNLLRGSLASSKLGYACIYSGRPKWLSHSLALGDTYGEITKLSQNSWKNYDAGYYQNSTQMALMGDPSLRHFMILPPKSISLKSNQDRNKVTIEWEVSAENDVIGYHIYRSQNSSGDYGNPINSSLIKGTEFEDNQPYEGTNYYLVKAVKITQTGSGSFTNMSLGRADSIDNIRVNNASVHAISPLFKLYPTITNQNIHISRDNNQLVYLYIRNNLGKIVIKNQLHSRNQEIDVSSLKAGLYYLHINGKYEQFLKY